MSDLFLQSGFWVLLSTILCFYVLYRYGRQPMADMLDQRTEKIQRQLDESVTLKSEAQTLLAEYERRHKSAIEEAEEIIEEAREKARNKQQKAQKQLQREIRRLEHNTRIRLEQIKREAELDLRNVLTRQARDKVIERLNHTPKILEAHTDHMIDLTLDALRRKNNV